LIVISILTHVNAIAQDRMITGRVVDSAESSIPGVSITVKNKKTAAISDAKGEFKIKATTGDILVFS